VSAMLKKRISQKSIIEEYKLLEGAGSLFRIRMNENWILRYKDHLQKKIIKKELNHCYRTRSSIKMN
jgi:hypothetical protein